MPSPPWSLRVEFFGIPRARAGVAATSFELASPSIEFREVLRMVAQRFPQFHADCMQGTQLTEAISANLDGERFIRLPHERLAAGETLLLLSADAGG